MWAAYSTSLGWPSYLTSTAQQNRITYLTSWKGAKSTKRRLRRIRCEGEHKSFSPLCCRTIPRFQTSRTIPRFQTPRTILRFQTSVKHAKWSHLKITRISAASLGSVTSGFKYSRTEIAAAGLGSITSGLQTSRSRSGLRLVNCDEATRWTTNIREALSRLKPHRVSPQTPQVNV